MVNVFWIVIAKTYNIAHFPRVLPKNVINLENHPEKRKGK